MVGNEALGGTDTTHIRAGINVPALLSDLNTFLGRASSVGRIGTANLPTQHLALDAQSDRQRDPQSEHRRVDGNVPTRRCGGLNLRLKLDTSGQAAALLGPRGRALALTMQYADLNQPQTIIAPTTVLPYSQFQDKLKVLLADLQSGRPGGLVGSGSGTRGSGSTGATDSGGSTAATRTTPNASRPPARTSRRCRSARRC